MPYNSVGEIPAAVKKRIKSAKRRRQWMHVWNSVFSRTHDEARAFASANSVTGSKEVAMNYSAKTGLFTMTEDELLKMVHGEVVPEPTMLDDEVAAEDEVEAALDDEGDGAVQPVTGGSKAKRVTMFEGPDDNDLPDHVKMLPANVRRQWISNHHYGLQDTQDNDAALDQADSYTMMSIKDMRKMMKSGSKAVLSSSARKQLSASDFAYVDADGNGHLPIHDAAHVRNAMARFDQTDMPASAKAAAKRKILAAAKRFGVSVENFGNKEVSVLDRIKAWFAGESEHIETNLTTFALKEGSDGKMRAVMVYSNQFKDHEGEIFAGSSHEEYVQAAEAGLAPYPELHLWHGGPDTRWGEVETVSYVDGFAVAGAVVDPGKEHVALKLKELADKGELAVSFGFYGLRGPDNVYYLYRPFEISPLPSGSAANPYTAIDLATANKENSMAWSDKKKAWFKEHFGMDDAAITKAEQKFGEMGSALKAAGIDWKEDAGEQPTPPAPAPVAPPTPVAGAADGIDMFSPLAGAIKELSDKVEGLSKEVVALKEANASSVAAAADDNILARIAGATNGGFRPTQAGSTVVEGIKEGGGSPLEWLTPIVAANFGAPVAAGAGAVLAPVNTNTNINNGEVK